MKKALIVVDYQNDFVSGSLGFPEAAMIEDTICNKIKSYQDSGHDVIFTFDSHDDQYLNTREGKGIPVEHCMEGSDGWLLYGKVAKCCDSKSVTLSKSTFGSLTLANYLHGQNYGCVELVGVVTDICVLSNAVLAQAALPEAKIIIDAAAVASNNPEAHERALAVMEGLQMCVDNRHAKA